MRHPPRRHTHPAAVMAMHSSACTLIASIRGERGRELEANRIASIQRRQWRYQRVERKGRPPHTRSTILTLCSLDPIGRVKSESEKKKEKRKSDDWQTFGREAIFKKFVVLGDLF